MASEKIVDITKLDLETLDADQLDNLSIDELLGNNIGDYDLSSNLPDGTYIGYIEKYELKKMAADASGEKIKKARADLSLTVNVLRALTLKDPNENPDTLVNRKHFERFNLLQEFGQAGLVKLVLGILGVSYRDKQAIEGLNASLKTFIDQLVSEKVAFGFTIANVEKGGYDNCNIVLKEKNFISAEDAVNHLD